MNAPGIPRVKRLLRQINLQEGARLVEDLFQFPTAQEITLHVEEEMGRRFPEIFSAPPI
jgi:phosphotransferase system enzyme I (PtsI)